MQHPLLWRPSPPPPLNARRNRHLTRVLAVLVLLLGSTGAWAQALTGTKAIPGDYATVALAIADLNSKGVGAGGVTFNAIAGGSETFASPTAGTITATGTSANPIRFQISGTGTYTITAGVGTSTTADAIITLAASDYVTFNGFTLTDPTSNGAAASAMEYGFLLSRTGSGATLNGTNNNTIQNCVITLQRAYAATGTPTGIFVSSGLAATPTTALSATSATAAGRSSNNSFTSNTIQNVTTGIYLLGLADTTPFANYDQGNSVGSATAGTGNTIRNFGGGSVMAYGVRVANQNAFIASNNTINNTASGGVDATAAIYGVFLESGTNVTATVNANTITLSQGAVSTALQGVNDATSGTGTITIGASGAGNTIALTSNSGTASGSSTTGCAGIVNSGANATFSVGYNAFTFTSAATSAAYSVVYNSTAVASGNTFTVTNNTFLNTANTVASTGTLSFFYGSLADAGPLNITNNQFSLNRTGSSGTVYGYYNAASPTNTLTFSGNTFSNCTLAGSSVFYGTFLGTNTGHTQLVNNNTFTNITGGSGATYGIYSSWGGSSSAYTNNTVTNLTGSGSVYGIASGGTNSQGGTYSGNTIRNITSSGASATVAGISLAGSSSGATLNIFNNKIADIGGTSAMTNGLVFGIYGPSNAVPNVNMYNNIIGNLTAPAMNATNSVLGISIPSNSNTINLYNNTIYLNASSTGANFGTTGINLEGTSNTTTLRNNIVVNKSTPNGTGLTVALRRSAVPVTGYSANSNNNLYYAGTPGASRVLYYDGTNGYQTLAAFQGGAGIAPRESNSRTEDVPFASTTGSATNFLHIAAGTPTFVESGGVAIATVTTDFDGDARGPYTGTGPYSVNGTPQTNGGGYAPDLGADEGDFTPQTFITVSGTPTYTQFSAVTGAGATNQAVVGLTIVTSGLVNPPRLNELTINLGTTNVANVLNPRLYSSPTSTFSLATATLIPSTATPAANYTLTVTGGTQLALGNNYYFLTYDIAPGAAPGDQISSAITSITVNTTSYTPTLSGAAGFLTVAGPMSGVYTINQSGSGSRNYTSFTAAINDLNARGIDTSVSGLPVTFNVAAGQTFVETTVPVITRTGLAAFPITFRRDPAGSGANPVLQVTGSTSTTDAALAVAGGDYFTFSNLTIAQATGSNALEFGIAFFRASATDGAQNNTVQNCTITLDKTNGSTAGIYSATTTFNGTAVTTSSAAGANSNNKFYNNTISNVAAGIFLNGFNLASSYDTGNDVGGAAGAATGNIINNFGGAAGGYGVYAIYQSGALLNNNTVNNTAGGGSAAAGPIYGVYQDASTATNVVMSNNTVTLTQGSANLNYGVYNLAAGAAANSTTMSNNIVTLSLANNFTPDNATSQYGVYNAAANGTVTLTNNQVTSTVANTGAGSYNGGFYGVYNNTAISGGALTMTGNTVSLTASAAAAGGFGSSGPFYGVGNNGAASAAATLSNNTVTIAHTVGGSAGSGNSVYGVYNANTVAGALTMGSNTVTYTPTMSASANSIGGTFYGVGNASAVTGALSMTSNTVSNSPTLPGAQNITTTYYGVYNNGNVASNSATALVMDGNTVNGTSSLTSTGTLTGGFYGVYNNGTVGASSAGNASLSNNNVLTTTGNTYVTTGTVNLLYNGGVVQGALAISGNTGGPATGTASFNTGSTSYLIFNSNATVGAVTVNGNTFRNLTSTGNGAFTGYYNVAAVAGSALNFTNNTINNITLGGTASLTGLQQGNAAAQVITVTGNTFTNLTAGTGAGIGINAVYGGATSTIANNTIVGFNGGGALTGIISGGTYTGSVSLNTIGNLVSTGGSNVYGINNSGATAIFRNKVYGLSGTAAGSVVAGIYLTAGTTVNIYNNLIGSLTAPNATNLLAVTGINMAASTAVNAYYNTIYLNASSSAATFGTSGIYFATSPTLTLRNNIIVNTSTAVGAGGYTAALRRVSGTTGTVPANYQAASNNNLFYAGAPSATNLLYVEGTTTATNPHQRLDTYKAFMATRDQASVTENPPFLSTAGSSSNFLHIAPAVPTQVEGGAAPIASYTDDYDAEARNATTPDIGADEGTFTPPATVTLTSLTYTQTNANTGASATNQLANTLTLTTSGSGAQPTLTAVTVDLTGTTNVADIAAARLYRSTSPSFSLPTATLVSTGTIGSSTVTFAGSQLLDQGANYFFVVYDIASGAGSGDVIASAITSVTAGSTYTTSTTPAITLSGAAGVLTVAGPMQGTYTINQSGSGSRNYTSFSAAINDLNARGINTAAYTPSATTGPVIFNVSRGQTFTEGGSPVPAITTTGVSGFPITFQRDPAGSGANPVLQVTGTASPNDAALALAGVDYFVFSGLDITQPTGLTSLEYGIALYRATAGDGAQNNTVQNCTITLSKANTNSAGIIGATTTAAGVAVAAPTTAAGANSNNKFYNNTISNVVSGIVFNGSNTPAFYDLNNDFGGTAGAATGNTVNNFGGAAGGYGIYAIYQSGALLNNNTVNNTANGGSAATGAIYGVYQAASTATSVVMSNNNVTLSQGSNNTIQGVYNNAAGAAANSVTMLENTVSLSITSNSASDQTGYTSYGVWNAAATGSVALNGNTVTIAGANTAAGSYNAGTYGVYNTGAAASTTGTLTLNNNTVTLTPSATAGGGFGSASFNGVSNAATAANTLALNSNTVSVNFSGPTGNSGFGQTINGVFNTSGGTAVNGLTMNLNNVANASTYIASTNSYVAQFNGVYNAAAVSGSSSTLAMNQNTVTNSPTSYSASGYTGAFYGVYNTGAVSGTGATAASFNANSIDGNDTFAGTGTLSGATYGVYNSGTITGGATMNNNNLFTNGTSYRTTGATSMLFNSGAVNNANAAGNSHIISSNTFGPASPGIAYFLWSNTSYLINNNVTTAGPTTVSNNTFQNIDNSGTGAGLFGYYNYSGATGDITLTQNTFANISLGGTSTFTGTFQGASASQKITVRNNTFTNIATGSGGGYAINYSYGAATSQVFSNTIAGFSSTGGTIAGVLIGPNPISTANSAAGGSIFQNDISGLSTTGAGTVSGVSITSTSTASTVNIYRNKIYDLSGSNAGVTVNGMNLGGSVANTVNVYNNLVGNLTAPNATGASAINGLLLSNSSTSSVTNISFNTVYLAAFSSGTNFGTSGFYASTDAPVNLRNNIFVNASSPNGTYATVAYRRGTAISAANTPVTTNDRNLYYAGGASANTLLYAQGTTSLSNQQQTIAAFKAYMGSPREANSGTEFPNFLSTNGADATFLHIDATNPTQVESGGINIAGITTDYDGDIRQGNPGYPAGGGGTAPDIGADEGTFLVADLLPPTITFTAFPNQAAAPTTLLTGITITDNVNVNISTNPPRLYFRRSTDANAINGNTSATDGWKYVVGTLTNTSSTTPPVYTYSFTVDYSLLNGGTGVTGGETINYFIVAQDRVSPANVGVAHGSFPPANIPTTVNLATANLPTGYDSYTIVPVLASTYTVGTGQLYLNLTGPSGLFAALNGGIAQSNIVVNVTSDLTEPGNVALNQLAQATGNNYTITIQPAAAVSTELLISGPGFSQGMIRLNGADNVTFDGGASRYFRFRNLNTVASPTFTFLNDAVGNTITRSTIESGNTSTTSGTVLFYNSSTAVASTGNDNNTITDNDIRGLSTTGGATHANAVYSFSATGTGTGTNSGITISNNRIYDWTNAGVLTATTGTGDSWTVSGNALYQTATRTTALTGIQLAAGSAHAITGNSIGGATATRGGTALTTSGAFVGIAIPSVTGSTHTISNNVLGNIANTGSSTNYGISFTGAGAATINGNRIGAAISGGLSSDTLRTNYDTYFIYNTASGTVAITNNVVNRTKMTSTGGDYQVGIYTSAGTNTITGNTVANMTTTSSSSTSDLAASGIYVAAATPSNIISGNTVYNIVNTTNTTSTRATGIYIGSVTSPAAATATLVERNRVYNVANTSLTSTGSNSGLAVGIRVASGSATYTNNMVSMGANTAGESRVSGIENASTGTNNFYYNSLYVNGTVAGTVNNSYAFQRSSTGTTTLRNNVFYNERTGGGGNHVGLFVSSTTGWTATSSDYNYLVTVDANKVVSYNGTVYSLSGYQTTTGGASNSLSSTTTSVTSANLFVNPATADLHVGPYYVTNVRSAPLESRGVAISGFTTDYDSQTRPGPAGSTNGGGSLPDIGADEFDGRPAGSDVSVVTIDGIALPVNAGTQTVQATVRNLGNTPLTSVTLSYTLNGGTAVSQSFTGLTVAPNATTQLTLGSLAIAQDINTIVVTSSLPNGSADEDPTNDTQTLTFRTTLVGAYTINKAAAASNRNFVAFMNTSTPTVNAAASSLAAYGVNGAVTLAVSNGAYTEQVLLPTIAGTSATNTVVFNGNGQTLTFAPTSSNIAVVAFTGADYTTLNNFVINPTGATYATGVILSGQSNNNTVSNNVINTLIGNSNSTSGGIAISNSLTSMTSTGDAANNTTISGNTVTGGYYGISMTGPTGTTATGNQVLNNTVRDIYTYSIYSAYQNAGQIIGNDISRPTYAGSAFYGIYMTSGNTGAAVERNRIHDPFASAPTSTSTTYAIYLAGSGTAAAPNDYVNNILYNLQSASTIYGVYNGSPYSYHRFYHNTVVSDYTASGLTYGYYQSGTASGIELKNNIFKITRVATSSQYALYFSSAAAATAAVSDYNDLYVAGTGTNYYTGYNGTSRTTLADWRTATSLDGNSVAVDPLFVNAATGNLRPTTNSGLDGLAPQLARVPNDITTATRNSPTDPGAYEFTPVAYDIEPTVLVTPAASNQTCFSAAETLSVTVRNNGFASINLSSLSPATVSVSVTTPGSTVLGPFTTTLTGTIAGNGGTLTVTVPGTIDMTALGDYVFTITTNVSGDGSSSNDVLTVTRTVAPPVAGTVSPAAVSLCQGQTQVLTVAGTANGTIFWQQSTNGTTFTDVSPVANGTTYTATATPGVVAYRVQVRCNGNVANSNASTFTIDNPQPVSASASPATVCEGNTSTITAVKASSQSAIRFYSTPTGGTPLAATSVSGNTYTYTTPALPAGTTNVYVSAQTGTMESVGPTPVGTESGSSLTDWGIVFDNNSGGPATLASTTIYSSSAGTVNIALYTASNLTTPLAETGNVSIAAGGATTPVVVPLNFTVPAGTGYRLLVKAYSGVSLIRGTPPGAGFPYTSASGNFRITSSEWGGTTTGTYYYFYNLVFGTQCEGTRVAVPVTATPAPAFTVTPSTTQPICPGTPVTVTGSFNPSDYDTFTYSPSTGVSQASTSSPNATLTPTTTTTYTVTASKAGAGAGSCQAVRTLTITVNPQPDAPVVTPSAPAICAGTSVALMASSSADLAGTIGTGTTSNPATSTSATYGPAPYGNYYGGNREQSLITAAELSASGLTAGSTLNSLSFFNAAVSASVDPHKNFQISLGNTALTALTAFQSGLTQVVAPYTYQPVVGTNTHAFTTPFVWDGVSNLIVETSFVNTTTGTSTSFSQSAQTYNSTTSYQSTILDRVDGDPTIVTSTNVRYAYNTRPNIAFGVSGRASYSWTLVSGDGLPATTNTSSITVTPTTTSVYRVTNTIVSTGCQNSTTVTVTVNTTTTWTGTTSTDWFVPTNWTNCVPSEFVDAIVPNGVTNMPTINSATAAATKNLSVGTTGTGTAVVLTLNGASTVLNIKGNLTTTATTSVDAANATTVNFSGSTAQTIGAGKFGILVLSGSGATAKQLGGAVNVGGSLNLSAGMLNTNGNVLTMLTQNSTIVGADANHYVITNGSTGRLAISAIGAAGRSTAVTFPIGTSTYTPAMLTNAGTNDRFSVTVGDGISLQGNGTSTTTHVVAKTWDVTEGTAGGSNVTLGLQWNASNEAPGFDRTNATIMHYENGAWNGQCYTCYSAATGSDPYMLTRSNITTFSPFAIQDNTKPLPVELTRFTAQREGNNALLDWSTASEKNNAGFEVQVSTDGRRFRKLSFVTGAGTANAPRSYSYLDVEKGKAGLRYYRLRQLDLDGQESFSPVRTVLFDATVTSLTAAPNPFEGDLTLTIQAQKALEAAPLTIVDASGRTVHESKLTLPAGLSQVTLRELSNLPAGMYMLHLRIDGTMQHVKVVKH